MKSVNYLRALLLVLLALTVGGISAANVDATLAQSKAVQFLNAQSGTRFMASAANVKLAYTEVSSVDAKAAAYYVFNYQGGGFVIVAGDDRAEEILGYGDRNIDMNNIPANMRWWLGTYKEQIEFIRANPKLQVETPSMRAASGVLKAVTVAPLLPCNWDQEAPYWNQCPTYSGSTCLTGCVATAMAQVMYYWKYPATLPAIASYRTSTRKITVSALSGTTLDWNNMIDDYSGSYTTAQATAVATLMRYCGQSCSMDYDTEANGGSGAYSEDQLTGMKLFGYNSGATYVERSNYTATQWDAMLQADLEAGRPVLYGGNDTSGAGGHAFVVDGYRTSDSKYHLNWGWSGDGNGYFAISALNVSGYKFNSYQDMLYQVYPEGQEGAVKYAPVMADASSVGTTSFTAIWTDETASENVTDYTLYVNAYTPGQNETLLTETFAGATASGSSNIASNLDNYTDNSGWTGSYVYQAVGGLRMGSASYAGSLTTPALDMSGCDGTITVKFNAAYWSSSDNTSITVSCGNASQTVQLTADATDYTVVLSGVTASSGQKVTFASSASKKRFYIYSAEVITGDASVSLKASETGDANSRVITGITGKMYTVTGLNQGGSYKFYVVANYTDGTTKESNVKTVTLDGTAVLTPEMIVDPSTLTMEATVGETATATFDMLAANLTGNVTVTLTDANGVFTVTPAAISMADAENGATVTVTYAPVAAGTHTATVTLSSEGAQNVTVALTGTATDPAIETFAPVMAAATNVATTSFNATWTDQTLPANVTDYTLYVNKVGATGGLLLGETFGGVTATNDGSTRIDSSLDTYCDNSGWTGTYVYQAGGGGLKFGNSSNGGALTTPALDLTGCDGTITVKFNAKNYGSDVTTVTVSCGDAAETVSLTDEATDYNVVLTGVTAAADQQVTLASSGSKKRWYLYSVDIYSGNAATLKAVNEIGDENSRVITGITAKTYTVQNLTAGATYKFYVVANYTDGTNANSNTEQVTLLTQPEVPTPEVIVDNEALTVNANVGESVTVTFGVLAADLTDEVTITLADENGVYTVSPAAISIDEAQEGATVTVTYTPTSAGTHTATITVASEGAEDVTVTVTGTAAMPLGDLVMLPADEQYITTSSFRADWTDETNAAYVQDYTLYVNIKGDEPTPGEVTELLAETFYSEDVPSTDSNIDIASNGTLDENCDNAGWTGNAVYLAGGGGVKLGAGSKIGYLTTPELDLTASEGIVTVKFNAKSYGNDGSSVVVSCGDATQTVELTTEAADYTIVLTGVTSEAGQTVTLSCTANKKRFYLYSVNVYSGEASEAALKAANETGDENSRVITGITDKYYVVEGLTAGATYDYYVVANYIDGTSARSNTEQVTLLEDQGHGYEVGDVNHDGKVSIADVTALIDYLLGSNDDACVICADVNGDTNVSIADVTALIDRLLGGE